MDMLEVIHSRRSIRQYADAPVTDAQVETVLRAAMAAPSASNQQPWRFVVVRDAAIRGKLAEATPYASPVGRAPVGIVVLGDTRDNKHPGFWVQDCAAAVENLLLATHAIGLGAVWIGVHPNEERASAVAAIVGAPDGVVPLCMIAVGVPAAAGPRVDRYRPEFVFAEGWSE